MKNYSKLFYKPNKDTSSKKSFKIYCFPHAGGGSGFINGMIKYAPSHIEIIGVQLAGRENRFQEPLNNEMDNVIHEVTEGIIQDNKVDSLPILLIGQCSGALLAYESALTLKNNKNLKGLIICSRPSPNYVVDEVNIEFSEDELLNHLKSLGGIDNTILNDPLMLELFLPIIKSDFKMVNGYSRSPDTLLNIPIAAFNGDKDNTFDYNKLMDWKNYTSGRMYSKTIDGGHFLFESSPQDLLIEIQEFGERVIE